MSLLHSGEELSLRHLPDLSDASFSFQIPGVSTAENLLADDTDFFRGGADVSMDTLASPRKANGLLTLSELTPRPPRNAVSSKIFPSSSNSSGTSYWGHNVQESTSIKPTLLQQPHPRPSLISTAPGPSVAAQTVPEQGELQTRKRDSDIRMLDPSGSGSIHQAMPTISEKPKRVAKRVERRQKMTTRSKTRTIVAVPSVTEPRITTRETSDAILRVDNPISSAITISAFPTSQLPGSSSPPDGDGFSVRDTILQSAEATDGVTERLVKIGERFMNPFSHFSSDNDNPSVRSTIAICNSQTESGPPSAETGTCERDAVPETDNNTEDGPLTISQLSPRKCMSPAPTPPTPPDNLPVSPSRSSIKRPVSDFSDSRQGRAKRIKVDTTSEAPKASSSTQSQEKRPRTRSVSRQPPKTGFSRSDTASQTRVAARVLRTSRSVSATAQPLPAQTQSSTLKPENTEAKRPKTSRVNAVASTSTRPTTSSRKSQSSSLRHKPSSSLNERKRPPLLSSESKPAWVDANGLQPPPNATQHADRSDNQPQPQSDLPSHSLSRSSHSRSQRRYETVHPIPDFKALHAAHEASLANRKENIHPTKPIEIQWETDIRAKERQRFDEMIKDKEREQERLMEQQRKEREGQEAREIRELRMKAIPKAHEVPEWYKDVPRKKDKGVSLDASGASSVRR